MQKTITCEENKAIEDLLVGRRVVLAEDHTLTLDNGTIIEVEPNEGCGGCANGWYHLDELNECEAVITSVRVDDDKQEGDSWESAYIYKIFVLAANKEQVLLSVSGDDGNGYYGTGYSLKVTIKED